jgi:hypothetical protein
VCIYKLPCVLAARERRVCFNYLLPAACLHSILHMLASHETCLPSWSVCRLAPTECASHAEHVVLYSSCSSQEAGEAEDGQLQPGDLDTQLA